MLELECDPNPPKVSCLQENKGQDKSVLVEGGSAVRTMATFIDLNAVRAGLVEDPKDFRWCGYGAACGGGCRGSG